MRALAVLGVKNEGAFLLDWLAHHRATGFTEFLVCSNDCTDGTDAMLDRLAALGWLNHLRNDIAHPRGPQWSALKAADAHPLMRSADWVLFLDIDEFVNIHAGDRTLSSLLLALPDATANRIIQQDILPALEHGIRLLTQEVSRDMAMLGVTSVDQIKAEEHLTLRRPK